MDDTVMTGREALNAVLNFDAPAGATGVRIVDSGWIVSLETVRWEWLLDPTGLDDIRCRWDFSGTDSLRDALSCWD